jgi:phosphomannomutase
MKLLATQYLMRYTFYMEIDQTIFRAYDIRGKYPAQINAETVAVAIPAIIKALKLSPRGEKTIIVGHDARLSSPELYRACIEALAKERGVQALSVGLVTTPMLYFLVNKHKAAGGITVTASHNPKDYNGLKMVRERAIPVSGKEVLARIMKDEKRNAE